MLIKACLSLLVKNCHAKGRELTLRVYSQLNDDRRVIVGREKFLQFAPWFYDTFSVDLLDLQLKHTVLGFLSSLARNFWRKKFSREQIFASGCLIA